MATMVSVAFSFARNTFPKPSDQPYLGYRIVQFPKTG